MNCLQFNLDLRLEPLEHTQSFVYINISRDSIEGVNHCEDKINLIQPITTPKEKIKCHDCKCIDNYIDNIRE